MDFVQLGANIKARRADGDEAQLRHTQAFVSPKTTPEAASDALKLARENNTTTEVVASDLDNFYGERKVGERDWRKMIEERPATAGLAADAETGPAVSDDIDNLSWIENVTGSVGQAWDTGEAVVEMGDIGFRRMTGNATPEDIARLNELKAQLKKNKKYDLDYFSGIPEAVAESLPFMRETITRSWDEILVGAGAGALIGGGAGLAAGGVGALPGAVGGAVTGGGLGLKTGMGLETAQIEAGNAYNEIRELRDDSGNLIGHDAALGAAAVVGAVNGLAEVLAFRKLASTIPGVDKLLNEVTTGRLIDAIKKQPAVRRAVMSFGRKIATMGLVEGATEGFQELSVILGGLQAGATKTAEGKDITIADSAARILHSGIKGSQGGIGMGSAGATAGAVIDVAKARRAKKNGEALLSGVEAAKQSKTAERLPDVLREHVERAKREHGGVEEVYVEPEQLTMLFQESNLSPEQIEEQHPGLVERIAEAVEQGVEVAIPFEEVIALSAVEGFDGVVPDIRVHPDEYTMREAEQMGFDFTEGDVAEAGPVGPTVAETVQQSLEEAGVTPEVAGPQAQLFASVIETQAEELGIEPSALMEMFPLDVVQQELEQDPDAFKADLSALVAGATPAMPEVGLDPSGKPAGPLSDEEIAVTTGETVEDVQINKRRQALAADIEELGIDPTGLSVDELLEALRGRTLEQVGEVEVVGTGPRGRVLIKDVGLAFDEDQKNQDGRQLFPETSEEDHALVLEKADADMTAQLKRPNSGVGWYEQDVVDALILTGEMFPTLLTEPSHRDLYLTFAGIFSNGMNPAQAWEAAALAFELFIQNGKVPTKRVTPRGQKKQMTTFKDFKTGEMVTKAAGWGVRNQSNVQQLTFIKFLTEELGSLEAAMAWMMDEHPPAEINQMMRDSGQYKAKYPRFTLKEEAGEETYGALVFGDKLGRYTIGLHGVDIDEGDTTIDLWYTRSYRRWTGRLFEIPIGKEGVAAQPKDDSERDAIFRITGELSRKHKVKPGDTQAVLWFSEKQLWHEQGVALDEGTNSKGAANLLEKRGLRQAAEDGDADVAGAPKDSAAVRIAKAIRAERALRQDGGVGPRGFLQFEDISKYARLTLTGRADLSTFLHESGHFFLEMMGKIAVMPEASDRQKADYAAIREWMGLKPGERIEREHHEKWAETFEAYLREGKAPSPALVEAFARFRAWLTLIYKRLVGMNVDLNDDIRGVMDRLIATDAAIAQAEVQIGVAEVMPFEDSGLTESEYAEYVQAATVAAEDRRQKLGERALAEVYREQTATWKKQKKDIEQQLRDDIGKSHAGQVAEALGDANDSDKIRTASITKGEARRMMRWTSVTGRAVDEVAAEYDFDTGVDLIEALEQVKRQTADVAAQADSIMDERHGKLTTAQMAEAALDAAHSEKTMTVLLTEFRALSREAGLPHLKRARKFIRRLAKEQIAQLPQRQIQPSKYRSAELKAAIEWAEARAKGDTQAALLAKRRQMLNHARYQEAVKAKNRVQKIRTYLRRFQTTKTRARFGKVGERFFDAISQLLDKVEFSNVSLPRVEERQRLAEFVQWAEENDQTVIIPPKLLAETGVTNYQDMNLEELEALRDAVANIDHLVGKISELKIKGEARQLGKFLDRAKAFAESKLGKRKESEWQNPTAREKIKEWFKRADASMLKPEFIFNWLGPEVHAAIFQPIADAQHAMNDMLNKINKKAMEPIRAMTKDQQKRMVRKTVFMGRKMYGHEVLAAAMNIGNEGNLTKLLEGNDWNREQFFEELEAFLEPEDMAVVQAVWDEIGKLWEPLNEVQKEATGLPLKEVVPVSFEFKGKTYSGGYYPVVYDPRRSHKAMRDTERKTTLGTFENNFTNPKARASAAEARTGYTGPILLSLDVIPLHIRETVHFITHYEAVVQANKIISHPRFKKLVTETMGREVYQTLTPFLEAVANDGVASGEKTIQHMILDHLRGGATIAMMGYRLSTMVTQTLGIFTTADEIGVKYTLIGLKNTIPKSWTRRDGKIENNWSEVRKKSGEIRHLIANQDRDMRHVMRGEFDRAGYGNLWARVAKPHRWTAAHAFHLMGYVQMSVNVATWQGAYVKALDADMTEAEAVQQADRTVRMTQSGGAIKDLSAMQRDQKLKIFTMFMTYFNVLYNRFRDVAKQNQVRPGKAHTLALRATYLVILPMLGDIAIRTMLDEMKGRDKDEDEDQWPDTPLQWVGKALLYSVGGVPILRDIMNAVATEYGYTMSPTEQSLEKLSRGLKGLKDPGEMTASEATALFEGIGTIIRLPVGTMKDIYETMTRED